MKLPKLKVMTALVLSVLAALSVATGCERSDRNYILYEKRQETAAAATLSEPPVASEPHKPASDPLEQLNLSGIPGFSGRPYIEINDNEPFFLAEELTAEPFAVFSDLDRQRRCGIAFACIGEETLSAREDSMTAEREQPSGYQPDTYPTIDGEALYHICELIPSSLTGAPADRKNLLTGTQYFATESARVFAEQVRDFASSSHHHVMYRATPFFDGENRLATGVLLEARSVEDQGKGVKFNVFCYNAQPNVEIDYRDGTSVLILLPTTEPPTTEPPTEPPTDPPAEREKDSVAEPHDDAQGTAGVYVLNTNTKKFHYPTCSSVGKIADKNRQDYSGSREEIIAMGYAPCKRCNP